MPVTALTIEQDLEEYSRFERDKKIVTLTVDIEGTSLLGEQVTVELRKARRERDVVVATKTLTATSDASATYIMTFDLSEITDSEGVPRVRRGVYFFRATSVTLPSITGETSDFLVSLITVDNLKNSYLHGTDQLADQILTVHEQPINITGIEVTNVSSNHPQSWFALTFDYGTDGMGEITRTLSWCGGPMVQLVSGTKKYTLRRGSSADYIEVRLNSFALLPTATTTDQLLVKRKPLSDDRIREFLGKAIDQIEESDLDVYIEPTRIVTIPDTTNITFDAGSDIPNLVGADWDRVVDALTYYAPQPGQWINFNFPYKPLIRFTTLFGQLSDTRIVDINLQWVEAHERGGFVHLVPFNQDTVFNFIGLVWVESLRGPVPLPNFWNFDALVGFRRTPKAIIEMVAKLAAIDILTIAGQAFRGGFSSQSISRDGVSESVSYTSSATYGIYSATIEDYRKWLDKYMNKFKGAFSGSKMVVV